LKEELHWTTSLTQGAPYRTSLEITLELSWILINPLNVIVDHFVSKPDEDSLDRAIYLMAAHIGATLALEMLLKCILKIFDITYIESHNLKTNYNLLPDDTKFDLQKVYEGIDSNPRYEVETVLQIEKQHKQHKRNVSTSYGHFLRS